jgi:uncharacterized membrane protein YkvA (DUF1232 family)
MANQFNKAELAKYQSEYSEPKFWDKMKEIIKSASKAVISKALLLYYVLQSPDVPLQHKATIIGALGYLILPIDLIPDFIAVIGYTDDVAALTAAYRIVKFSITPEIEARAKAKADKLF